uniref:KTSC domain-containing protein n=1 Tax=Strongyloides stercoralis TaxID=6248 RepID=A0A0K0EQ60_STRER
MNRTPSFQKTYDSSHKDYIRVEIFNGWLINSLQNHKIHEIPFLSNHTISNFNEKNFIYTNQILGQLLVFNYSKTRFIYWINGFIGGTIAEAELLYNSLKKYTTAEPVREGNGSIV